MSSASPPASNGWTESAEAWIADMGEHGDFGRRYVLDPALRLRLEGRGFKRALDVGCGEGRMCRLLSSLGVEAVGLDPTEPLLDAARKRDPAGAYVLGQGEALPFPDQDFDLVLSCMSLIDIPDYAAAIAEMARVLKPGGTLLVANLNSFKSAQVQDSGLASLAAPPGIRIDRYLESRSTWEEWRGIAIRNWHRPLSAYMAAFLGQGLQLTHFDEPEPVEGADPRRAPRYRRAPWYLILEWRKPQG